MNISQESAETLGLQCLGWLVANEDLLPVFLDSTGVSEADLRGRAQEPEFLASVLDFMMMNDAWVIAFCGDLDIPGDRLMMARAALPGFDQMNWT